VAAYRSGYLPYERRALEEQLKAGTLRGVAATNALELGVDIAGLDAVLVAGWPGTRASLWQQAGRAGRAKQEALAVFVARDDPLDTYVVTHPAAVFGQSVEATVLDPDNPYVLAPHLCAAAAESPLTDADVAMFGPSAPQVLDSLERRGLLRRRASGWYWTRRDWAADLADLRGAGGQPVRLVESGTGRLLGTVDHARAHATVHSGAVYVHQGETYLVDELDLEEGLAVVRPETPDYTTTARDITDLRVLSETRSTEWGSVRLVFGSVEVSSQVVSFLKRRLGSGEILGEEPLDLPPRQLRTRAVWWTLPDHRVAEAGIAAAAAPGAAHAAEHAAIGMLPLVATCDRWDVGGMSTARHVDTGLLTIFVHDGHPGGAGFAERGFDAAAPWLRATREAIAACSCPDGCPSCVQSPKCGNGNEPLDKTGAIRLLDAVLAQAPAELAPCPPA
jgi:DEAD/DEAH box helicase domain-containing protein